MRARRERKCLCGHEGLEELRLRKEKESKEIKKMEREIKINSQKW